MSRKSWTWWREMALVPIVSSRWCCARRRWKNPEIVVTRIVYTYILSMSQYVQSSLDVPHKRLHHCHLLDQTLRPTFRACVQITSPTPAALRASTMAPATRPWYLSSFACCVVSVTLTMTLWRIERDEANAKRWRLVINGGTDTFCILESGGGTSTLWFVRYNARK